MLFCLFFKQKTSYGRRISDWSSYVCSADLPVEASVIIASLQDSPSRGRELPLDGSSAILRMFVERPGEQGGSEGRGAPLGRGRRHLEFYIHQLVERVLNPIVGIVGAPQLALGTDKIGQTTCRERRGT